MRKYLLILAAALAVCVFSGCDEEATLPYIPVEKPEGETPSGQNPETYTVNYRLNRVLLCSPENPDGANIIGKLNFFSKTRMTLNVSPLGTTVVFENGDVPFYPLAEALPEGEVKCVLDTSVAPTVLRLEAEPKTVIATFEKDGFTMAFQLDCKALTYKYKFTKTN